MSQVKYKRSKGDEIFLNILEVCNWYKENSDSVTNFPTLSKEDFILWCQNKTFLNG